MHHKLDIHPIPTDVLYVNELSLAGKAPYETKQDMDKALTGRTKSNGGILPDDNVRIYVPMDLNAAIIMWQLYSLHSTLGYSTEKNESSYCSGVGKVISQLEIYDQVWAARNLEDTVQKKMAVCGTAIRVSNLQSKSRTIWKRSRALPNVFRMMRLRS